MNINDELAKLKPKIKKYVELMKLDSGYISAQDARDRMSKFLLAQSSLMNILMEVDIELTKYSSVERATYSKLALSSGGKSITEKKLSVESDDDYIEAKESRDDMEAYRNYLKSYVKIFENAHIMFRQLSKD